MGTVAQVCCEGPSLPTAAFNDRPKHWLPETLLRWGLRFTKCNGVADPALPRWLPHAQLCREVRDRWPWHTHGLLCKQHAPARECLHSHQCCLLGGPQELSPRTNHSRTEKRDWLLMEHSVIIFGSFGTISAPSLRLQVAQMHPKGQEGSWRWLIQGFPIA